MEVSNIIRIPEYANNIPPKLLDLFQVIDGNYEILEEENKNKILSLNYCGRFEKV